MSSAAARRITATPSLAFLQDVFRARCEARAILVEGCLYDLQDALDDLQADAERTGLVYEIGQNAVQKMMAEAFAIVPRASAEIPHQKTTAEIPQLKKRTAGAAASTLAAAEYLVQQNNPKRFRAWLAIHMRNERLAIKYHFEYQKL
jgi:hypothetical protein